MWSTDLTDLDFKFQRGITIPWCSKQTLLTTRPKRKVNYVTAILCVKILDLDLLCKAK